MADKNPWDNWEWMYHTQYKTWELKNGEEMLCWIEARNSYCDRGHYIGKMNIAGLDHADFWPTYYMEFEAAKTEMEKFLKWRLYKHRNEMASERFP